MILIFNFSDHQDVLHGLIDLKQFLIITCLYTSLKIIWALFTKESPLFIIKHLGKSINLNILHPEYLVHVTDAIRNGHF